VTLIVPRRNRGPIVSVDAGQQPVTALSVQYTGSRATFELETLRRVLKAGDLDDFTAALQYFDVGSQNWAYADLAGNVAYFTSAELPIREDLQNLGFPDGGIPPFFIRDGTHALRHEWLPVQNPQPQQALGFEILPFAEMPQTVNPAAGYVLNANNDPVGTTVDNDPLDQLRPGGGLFYLSPGYADGLRAGRIARLLEAVLADDGKATAADLEAMQANNQLLDAELVAPFLVAAFAAAAEPGAPAELQALASDPGVAEAVTRLMAWDYSTPTGIPRGYDPGDDPDNLPPPPAWEVLNSVAATIWSVYRGQLTRAVVDDTLTAFGLGDFLPGSGQAYKAVAHLLQTFDTGQGFGASGVDFFAGPDGLTRAEKRDLVLLQALRSALDLLAGDAFAPAFGGSSEQNGYRWGYLHRIVFDHPVGGPFSVPPAAGFDHLAPELPGIARSGGYGAVDASSHSARADGVNEFMFGSGPARRFVGVLDPAGIDAEEILPGGQSGVLGSPAYANQLGRWLTNQYHPLLLNPEAVVADATSTEEFLPGCTPGPTRHCFQRRRFAVRGSWSVPFLGGGPARTVPGASGASGNLYFFNPDNWELLVKVLDGCDVNGHYWVFIAGATNVGWELTVEDTETGEQWTAGNPFGQISLPVTDTMAFATCP
jgi:penicillin amidase